MSGDCTLGALFIALLATGYPLPSIIVTMRGRRRAWLYWLLNVTLGWSAMMWAHLLVRAIVIDHDGHY
jgi:hypothetical protein